MMRTVVSLCLALVIFVPVGCSDGGPDFPAGDGGWQLVLDVGHIPNSIGEYPVVVSIGAQTIDLTTGGRPSDGTILVFSASDGFFQNGLPEIELAMVDGRAEAELQVGHSGMYEVSVEFPQESCTAVATFAIGI